MIRRATQWMAASLLLAGGWVAPALAQTPAPAPAAAEKKEEEKPKTY
jgi:hypothetical protein